MSRRGIKCPRCGNANDLGRVFCSKCGVRLDLSRVNTRVLAKGMHRRSDSVFRLVRFLVFIGLLVVISLMLWPVGLTGEAGSVRDARSAEQKLEALIRAQQAGLYVFEAVSEREVNAYLAAILRRDESISKSEGMQMGIEAVTMSILPEALTVVVFANWGPLRLSYEVTGIPVIDSEGFSLIVASARWGHLPLPGPASTLASVRVAGVFSQMRRERRLLDQLERCDLGMGKVRLVTRGRR